MNQKMICNPIAVKGERVWRTYVGGKKLDELQGIQPAQDSHMPELWVLSTIEAKNAGREEIQEGKCYLKQDKNLSLSELIKAYPEQTLGTDHYKKYYAEMGVLVKLIDSKERLTIQVHPTKEKGRKYFDSDYGKTECWHIIETREDASTPSCIYIGFKEHVTKDLFNKYFEEQNLSDMLELLHCIPVHKGDTFIIPGGIPHAIGAGCALIEIQEPTDYTLRVEQTTPSGFKIDKETCHQGIGVEAMMDCFNFKGMSEEEILALCQLNNKTIAHADFSTKMLVGYGNTPYFQMQKITITKEYTFYAEESFFGLIVLSGEGSLISIEDVASSEQSLQVIDQFFISSKCKPFKVMVEKGCLEIIKIKGPK